MENSFVKPHKLNDALKYLNNCNSNIIAGGTDLIIDIRNGKKSKVDIIDISSIEELKNIVKVENIIEIGAGCTHSSIEKSEIINNYLPMLAKGCSIIGSTLIRNRGTIGGNIVNNSNCADSIPPLLIMNAKIMLQSQDKIRTIDLSDFFMDRGKLDIKQNEILTKILIEPMEGYKWNIEKVGRRKSLAISRITLALALKQEGSKLEDIRICIGAVLPKHQRLSNVEDAFKGKEISADLFNDIAEKSSEEVNRLAGIRWSSEYKIPVLKGLIMRTLEQLSER